MGFKSKIAKIKDELSLAAIDALGLEEITIELLQAHDVIQRNIKRVKVIGNGTVSKAIVLKGIEATKSARAAIETAGGRIED